MVSITESACKELDAYFADKPKAAIRIYLSLGGCSGPRLSLALDDAGEGDVSFESSGYTFVVEKGLSEKGQPFTIDTSHMGFSIDSKLELSGGGGCGSSCASSCGCS